MYNHRIVKDFKINKEFYTNKLGFECVEGINADNEKILTLKYEENTIQFMLKSSIKDVTKYLYTETEIPLQLEVQNLEFEKDNLERLNFKIKDYIPSKEFQIRDCNDLWIRYFQYEIANLTDC
jgi:hypothetical protein